ncbi:MAG: hypothetical protein WCJ45_01975 [bacterium]
MLATNGNLVTMNVQVRILPARSVPEILIVFVHQINATPVLDRVPVPTACSQFIYIAATPFASLPVHPIVIVDPVAVAGEVTVNDGQVLSTLTVDHSVVVVTLAPVLLLRSW